MITAVAKISYLTVGDFLALELPHIPEQHREAILWEYTGYPCFFSGEDHPIHIMRQQLKEFREGRALSMDQLVAKVKADGTWPT